MTFEAFAPELDCAGAAINAAGDQFMRLLAGRQGRNGVEFSVWVEQPDGQERRIFRRLLDPWSEPADRGDQHVVIPYVPRPGERLRFSSGPGGGAAYDWSYWTGIEVR